MNDLVEKFKTLAGQASFHYADDSCKEWGQARECEYECRYLWERHPELRKEFEKIMAKQLWVMR